MNTIALITYRSVVRMTGRSVAGIAMAIAVAACGGNVDSPASQWVATWYSAQQDYNEVPAGLAPAPKPVSISNQTIRQIVHTSYGGSQTRVKLSNLLGTTPVTFSAVRMARSTGGGGIDATTDRAVTFNGSSSVTLAAGAEQWSDSVSLPVPTQSDLAISLFVQGSAPVATAHTVGQQTNYFVSGNQSSAATLSGATTSTSYYWLEEVDISTEHKVKVVVAFGDSITDGVASTIGANHRWPNLFDDRVQAAASSIGNASVVNAGISGNRWLHNVTGPAGQGRFARDVMGVSGATHVVILLGINDIGFGVLVPSQAVSSDQIITAITAAIEQAKTRQMQVFVATLLPFQGTPDYGGAMNQAQWQASESIRQAVNAFVRSAPGIDGVIDFDKTMRDPANPTALLPVYDAGDHLHPNDAGYQAMANAIDLSLINK